MEAKKELPARLPGVLGLVHNEELSADYVRASRETDRPSDPVLPHSHPFFELAYVRSGPELEYAIGPDRYRIRPGDVLFIPPEVPHGAVFARGCAAFVTRDVLWLSPHFLNRMAQMQRNLRLYGSREVRLFRPSAEAAAQIGDLFDRGIREQQAQELGWEAMLVGSTMILFSQLTRALVDASVLIPREDRPELLLRVMDHIETHLAEKLTLEDTAARFDVSKSTLTQLFRKKLDISFYAYLTKRRLTVAKGLIARGMPLEQVGKQVGFREHSAFYRAFRQEYGISPREYSLSCREDRPNIQTKRS